MSELTDLPADIRSVLLAVLATGVIVTLSPPSLWFLRLVVGLVFVVLLPGYTLVAALYPEQHAPDSEDRQRGLSTAERLLFSISGSFGLVPLVGVGLSTVGFPLRTVPLVASLSLLTVGLAWIAVHRRRRLPVDRRFSADPVGAVVSTLRPLLEPTDHREAALNALIVVSVLAAVGLIGHAVTVGQEPAEFSELYLLTENETGELTADGYPTEATVGEELPLVVVVENHERMRQNYTLVVELQEVTDDNESVIERRQRVTTISPTLSDGGTSRHGHVVSPTFTGDRLRLSYMLYRGTPPTDPTPANAYREVHLWLTVTEGTR